MRIVVLDDYSDALRRLIGLAGFADHQVDVHTEPTDDPAEVARRLVEADVAVLIQQRTQLGRDVIERLPALRLIIQTGRNLDHIDLAACNRRGIAVSAGGGGSPSSTAELTWALILAAARDLPAQVQHLREGRWLDSIGLNLEGRTLGVYAFGRIGSVVARIGQAFSMRVVCFGRDASRERARAEGFEVTADRAGFFSEVDVLTLHLPLRSGTRGLIGAADLAAMKPTAILVNTSRAGLIAPGVLEAALRNGRPGLAAVDVYQNEPVLGGRDPLLALPNALCTPHLGYVTDASYRALLGSAVERLRDFLAGRPIVLANAPAAD
ncbi:MAG TPA: D-2-hydroxyacid dehydrogenase family protein [Alphaproteobacteria bacterium]|nr:D-2-hydroxyacid dehydrogenase family protein [Alphaproteobacteria bacterium]